MDAPITLDHIVLRCRDLERSRAFYGALGLQLTSEQHGAGSPHCSCALGDVVLELYPLRSVASAGVRLGLRVPNVRAAVEAVRRLGGEIVRENEDGAVLRDPDGHDVSLVPPARK